MPTQPRQPAPPPVRLAAATSAAASSARGLRELSNPPAMSHASTSADWRMASRSARVRPSSKVTVSTTCQPAASAARRAALPESSRLTATIASRAGRPAVWHSIRLAPPMRSSSPSSRRGSAESTSWSTSARRSALAPQDVGCAAYATRRHRPRTRPITPAFAHAEPTSTSSAISARTSVSLTGRAPASRRAGSRRDPPAGSGATESGIPASRRSRRSEASAPLLRRQ